MKRRRYHCRYEANVKRNAYVNSNYAVKSVLTLHLLDPCHDLLS